MARGPDKQFDVEDALEAAMGLFWSRGYEGTSLAELTDAMGIGRKSLYDTFGNKRALFEQSLEHYAHHQYREMVAALSSGATPLDGIRALMQRWHGMSAHKGSPGCLLGNNMAHFPVDDVDMARRLRGYFDAVVQLIAGALEQARAQGQLAPDVDLQDLARLIVTTSQGTALVSRVDDEGEVAGSVVRAVMGLLAAD